MTKNDILLKKEVKKKVVQLENVFACYPSVEF